MSRATSDLPPRSRHALHAERQGGAMTCTAAASVGFCGTLTTPVAPTDCTLALRCPSDVSLCERRPFWMHYVSYETHRT